MLRPASLRPAFSWPRVAAGLLTAAASAFPARAADDPEAALPVLRFADLYRRPIGPRGLEPSARLTGLAGARVRLVGYAVRSSEALAASAPLILTPRPVRLDDEDEGLADDLPASAVYVVPADAGAPLGTLAAGCPGPVGVVGTLELGRRRETDERISYVRLRAESLRCLDPAPTPAAGAPAAPA